MTDYNTLQKQRNYIVGAFVLVAFMAFIWMLGRFRDLPLFVSQANSFYIMGKFTDVPGVQKETPIQFCGCQIGRVVLVGYPTLVTEPNSSTVKHEVSVTMAIDNRYKNSIPSNARLMVMKRGLGSSFIELHADPTVPAMPLIAGRPETKFLCEGLVINGTVGQSSEFFPPEIQKKMEGLLDSIASLASNANQILGDNENKANIKRSIDHIALATQQAQQTLKSVQQLTNVGTDKLTQIADDLDTATKEFQQVLAKINTGQGTAGRLLNDGRLYENLLDSSLELEMALEQVKKWAADAREKGIRIKW